MSHLAAGYSKGHSRYLRRKHRASPELEDQQDHEPEQMPHSNLDNQGDADQVMVQEQEVGKHGDAVKLGQVLKSVLELQNSVVAGFKDVAVKMNQLSTQLAKVDERVKTLETTQTARDKSYIRLLKPIHKAVVKTGPYDIEWPLETLEEIHAVEAQMGDFAFDNFLVSNIYYQGNERYDRSYIYWCVRDIVARVRNI